MDEFSNSGGFGISGSNDDKKGASSAPQVTDFLDDSSGEGSNDADESSQDNGWDLSKKRSDDNQGQEDKTSKTDIQKWTSEENTKERRQNYLEERIRISISKYLGNETLNEYVTRIEDVDRTGAENESKIWETELEKQIIPMFVGVHNSFSRDMVADAVQSYFRDNVPIVAQIISEIRIKDRERMKEEPREIYLDFLRKFLNAYFNEKFSDSFAEIKKMTRSEADNFLSGLRVKLEESYMKDFDSVKFNSFDEEAIFRKTEDAVLEELKK